MLAGSLSSVLKTRQFAVAPSMSAKKAPSQIASQTTRVSGLYAPSRVNTSRSYAAKSGGDLFETVLGGGEAVKDGGAAASNVLKPRIPVKREHSKPNKMRKKYKHANFLESVAHKRRVPTSMKKVWHEARAIRRLPVAKAMSFLEVYPTRSAKHLRSAVNQAKCNAVWRGFRAEDLEISRIVVGKGAFIKRMMPHAKGRAGRVTHPFHSISVYVRPTKKALKENEAEIAARLKGEEPAAPSSTSGADGAPPVTPVEKTEVKKGKGWWPFGKKQEASL